MAVTFKAVVSGDAPAHRLMILKGRNEEGVIEVGIADNTAAADFVSTRALTDGEIIEVNLMDGVRIWEVEAQGTLLPGQWVASRDEGKVGNRSKETTREAVGFVLEGANEGELAKIVRRESLENAWSAEVETRITDLETRVAELEGGGA